MPKLDITPRNTLRFAFWGAEESGLIGATYYVNNVGDTQLSNTMVNLNFDMVGSPNFVRFVCDGDGPGEPATGPENSAKVERISNNYFENQGLQTEPTAFDGRSDYRPFIDNGIPTGGLFSGAEDIKSAREAGIYGGTPGTPYDPCYHERCDNINNLSTRSLNELGDGAAHATFVFAKTRQPMDGDPDRRATTAEERSFAYLGNHLQR